VNSSRIPNQTSFFAVQRSAQLEIEEKDKIIAELQTHKEQNEQNDIDELQAKLAEAENKIAETEKSVNSLNGICAKLHSDNCYLVCAFSSLHDLRMTFNFLQTQQLSTLKSQNLKQAEILQAAQQERVNEGMGIQTLQEVESRIMKQPEGSSEEQRSESASSSKENIKKISESEGKSDKHAEPSEVPINQNDATSQASREKHRQLP
jgi:hypothetical protein